MYKVDFELDFKRNTNPGKFIVLEGIDASGKTTHVNSLYEYFTKLGKDVLKTKEPTREGPIGELIHKILRDEIKVPSVALQYLFAADRHVHLETTVIPALRAGKIVISDRYFWSSVAYGIADKEGVNYENVGELSLVAQSLLSMYNQFIIPDITFYLDISAKTAVSRLERMTKEKEIYERREKLDKILLGYKWLIKEFPQEIKVINGEQSLESINKEILKSLSNIK